MYSLTSILSCFCSSNNSQRCTFGDWSYVENFGKVVWLNKSQKQSSSGSGIGTISGSSVICSSLYVIVDSFVMCWFNIVVYNH